MIGRLRSIVQSHSFDAAILVVIVANAIVLALQTYPNLVRNNGDTLNTLNDIF